MGWQCNGTGRVGKVEETTTNIVKGEKQERKRGGEGRGGEERRKGRESATAAALSSI